MKIKATKTELANICKQMLREEIPVNIPLLIDNVFCNHPEWDLKKGCGIKDIVVGYNMDHGSKCFYIIRTDNTKTDISYTKSLTPPNPYSEFQIACRTAVEPQIEAFRKTVYFGKDKCPITSETLYEYNTHIDHHDPMFIQIIADYIKLNNWEKDDIITIVNHCINKTDDLDSITKFIEPTIEQDFQNYHQEHAKLRAINNMANLQRSKQRLQTLLRK